MTDKRQVTTAGRLGNERGRRTAVDALLEPDTVLALMLLGLALAVVLSAAPGEPENQEEETWERPC